VKKWVVNLQLTYNVEGETALDAVNEAADQLRQWGHRAPVMNVNVWRDEPIPPFASPVAESDSPS
jgi:hypothetical protein